MKKFIAVSALFILLFSQTAIVQADNCPSTHTQLSDGSCFALNESSSSANSALLLLGAAAVGYGIYKISSSDDTPEEANLRVQEISNGYGIRLNNIDAPIRISTLKPLSNNTLDQVKDDNGVQLNQKVGVFNIEYTW